MEVEEFFRLLKRRWALVVTGFLATIVPTFVMVDQQPQLYESASTFIVQPRPLAADDLVRAVDTLSRGAEIHATYAELAASDLVKQRALDRLGVSPQEAGRVKAQGEVLTGSNTIEIRGTSADATLARDFTAAVSDEMAAYVQALDDAFELKPLDAAKVPTGPVSPDKPRTLFMGGTLGLLLGLGLMLLIEYLRTALVQRGGPLSVPARPAPEAVGTRHPRNERLGPGVPRPAVARGD